MGRVSAGLILALGVIFFFLGYGFIGLVLAIVAAILFVV